MDAHISIATLLQHLLFVFLLVIAPAWDYYDTRRLKQNPASDKKLAYYRTLCIWLWIAALVACVTAGWRSIFTIAPGESAAWMLKHAWAYYAVGTVIALFTAVIVLPYVTVLWKRVTSKPRKYASAELMQKLSYAYLFPKTRDERRWWVVVGLTAGICEEIAFRGFLLHYLTSLWGLGLVLAIVVSCLVFGLQHLYQGAKGVVATALIGALFALLFVLSGSLVLPIILHAATDLRLLVILPPEKQAAVPGGTQI